MSTKRRTAVQKYIDDEEQVYQVDDLKPGKGAALIEGKLIRHHHATDKDERQDQAIP